MRRAVVCACRRWLAPSRDAMRCVRPLLRNGALLRWSVVVLVAARTAGAPPRLPDSAMLLWVLWVAGYNAALPWMAERLPPPAAARVAQVLVLADVTALLTLVETFRDSPPGTLYAGLTLVLIEAAVCWGAPGVIVSSLLALVGPAALDGVRSSLLHAPARWSDLAAQSVVVTLLSAGLVMAHRLFPSGLVLSPAVSPETPAASGVRLSGREREVLDLIAEGCSNTMIARRLHVTESTVKRHVESILNRLNAPNRAGAVAAASRLGLLDD